ncbi:MAG TPA: Uma2 family endonuclease, partial [Blastocatellia bacterium]|nr:Uma2 family endonuclease [Blastocatellia bacterium]
VYAMAGAPRRHNLIVGNVFRKIGNQLEGKSCETYSSEMKVRIPHTGKYNYPDVVVVCGKPIFSDEREDILLNPKLIIEVLSPSTEARDRGEKFREYRSIESFTEYVLISQDKLSADHFVKQNDIWTIREVEEEITLFSIPCTLKFADIYERIEFTESNQQPEAEAKDL